MTQNEEEDAVYMSPTRRVYYTPEQEEEPYSYRKEKRKATASTQDIRNHEVVIAGGKGYEFVKRTFDIFSSALFLLLFGWFILLLMFIKFCEDGHNPIYTSERVGKNGKIFKFRKIRSMIPGAEEMKKQMIKDGLNEEDGPAFKMKNDPRITKFGKFLRKTSLDELPQIWDIFVGNMSVIGPRSPIPEEVKEYTPYEMHRLDVKGGLLCYWQITHDRNSLSFDEWVDLDVKYVETRSVRTDLKILFKGAWFVLTDHSGE